MYYRRERKIKYRQKVCRYSIWHFPKSFVEKYSKYYVLAPLARTYLSVSKTLWFAGSINSYLLFCFVFVFVFVVFRRWILLCFILFCWPLISFVLFCLWFQHQRVGLSFALLFMQGLFLSGAGLSPVFAFMSLVFPIFPFGLTRLFSWIMFLERFVCAVFVHV